MKYRRLRPDELEILQDRFVQFLAANTVTGADWVKLKEKDIDKANGLIDLFSDLVFDETLGRVKFLEHRTATELRCFKCEEEKIVMLGLVAKDTQGFDFRKNVPPAEMMDQVKKSGGTLQFFSAEKKYKGDRKQELFRMMENHCLIATGDLYRALEMIQPGTSAPLSDLAE